MNNESKWSEILLVSTLSLFLAACSSGGGSSGSSDDDDSDVAASLSGTSVKGVVRGGLVTANELSSAGEVLREVGMATTDNNGDYTLTLSDDYEGGPIELVLSAVAGTTMVCDVSPSCGAVAFGDPVDLDDTFEMSAMLGNAEDGDTLTTHITPFTHMAAERARQATTLDTTAVDAANSEVSNLLGGLDILRLQPVDITDSAAVGDANSTEQIYGAMVSAIARMAYDDGQTLEDTLDLLATSFSEGTMVADDSDGDDAAQISLQEIIDSVSDQLTELDLDDDSGVITDLETDVADAAAGSGVIDPQPSDNAGDPEIELAKSLMQDTRTWVNQVADLETPADTFTDEVEMVDSVSDAAFDALGSSLTGAFELMVQTYDDLAGEDGTNTLSQSTENGTGTITVSSVDGITTIVFDGTLNDETVDMTATFSEIGANTATVLASLDGMIANDFASLTLDAVDVAAELSTSITFGEEEPTVAIIDAASFSGAVILAEESGVDPVAFEGGMSMVVERYSDVLEDDFLPTELSLNGQVSNTNNSFAVNASVTLDNVDTFNPDAEYSATNFPETTTSLSFSTTLNDLPQAQITLTLNTTGYDDTALDEDEAWVVDIALVIAHDGATLRLELSEEAIDNSVTFTLTATNQDGAQLVFSVTASDGDEVTDISGGLTVDNEEVASLSLVNDSIVKVSYADGTFETLN